MCRFPTIFIQSAWVYCTYIRNPMVFVSQAGPRSALPRNWAWRDCGRDWRPELSWSVPSPPFNGLSTTRSRSSCVSRVRRHRKCPSPSRPNLRRSKPRLREISSKLNSTSSEVDRTGRGYKKQDQKLNQKRMLLAADSACSVSQRDNLPSLRDEASWRWMIGATEACSSCAKPIGANVFSWVCVFHDPWEIGRETSQCL